MSKNFSISTRQLTASDRIYVKNLENGAEAEFLVDEVFLFGIGFFPLRVLREVSLSAWLSGDWYPLSYLKRKNIVWRRI